MYWRKFQWQLRRRWPGQWGEGPVSIILKKLLSYSEYIPSRVPERISGIGRS